MCNLNLEALHVSWACICIEVMVGTYLQPMSSLLMNWAGSWHNTEGTSHFCPPLFNSKRKRTQKGKTKEGGHKRSVWESGVNNEVLWKMLYLKVMFTMCVWYTNFLPPTCTSSYWIQATLMESWELLTLHTYKARSSWHYFTDLIGLPGQ